MAAPRGAQLFRVAGCVRRRSGFRLIAARFFRRLSRRAADRFDPLPPTQIDGHADHGNHHRRSSRDRMWLAWRVPECEAGRPRPQARDEQLRFKTPEALSSLARGGIVRHRVAGRRAGAGNRAGGDGPAHRVQGRRGDLRQPQQDHAGGNVEAAQAGRRVVADTVMYDEVRNTDHDFVRLPSQPVDRSRRCRRLPLGLDLRALRWAAAERSPA